MQTPEADDPEVQGSARDTGGAGNFWQRYSGRADEPAQDDAESDNDRDFADPIRDREATDPSAGSDSDEASSTHHHGDHHCLEWCPICRGAELLRDAVPPELQEQFQVVQRDALLMAQALIESQLERMRTRPTPQGDSSRHGAPDAGDHGGRSTGTGQGPDLESIPIE